VILGAGRRIDPADQATRRFPLANVPLVRRRVMDAMRALHHRGMHTAVTSGACGADLLLLDVAGALGMRRIMVLPYDAEAFKGTSVDDRPGDWGALFDRIRQEMMASNNDRVVELALPRDGHAAYAAANDALVEEAMRANDEAHGTKPPATVVVWDGRSHGKTDLTAALVDRAKETGSEIIEVLTL
jgi:hypothetical protein